MLRHCIIFFSSKIEEHKHDSKKLWQQLKTLGYSNKTKGENKVVLDIDGETCFDSNKVANYINEFYTSVASTLINKLPSATNKFSTESDVFKNYNKSTNVTSESFKVSSVSIDFVYKELLKLKANKSTGLDGIPAQFLKDGAAVIKDHAFIINLSITSNTVPTDMKFARVKPLFKKNSRSDVGNYRPVSILSTVSKILSESVATSVIRKVCGRLCFLYRQGHFLNERSRRTLCTALLQCHFDYCCSSWFSSLSTKLKNKLQVMQNKMVRFILKLGPRSHIGDEELKTVGMLRVEDRVRQLKLNHVFKIYNEVAP